MLTDQEKQIVEQLCKQNEELKEENRELTRLVDGLRISLNDIATYDRLAWFKRLLGMKQQETYLQIKPLLKE